MRYAQYQRRQRDKSINRAARARNQQPVAEVVAPTTPTPTPTPEEQPKKPKTRAKRRKSKPAESKKKA